MSNTRGNLVPAKIYEADETGEPVGGVEVACMFNPFEYTVSKKNQYQEDPNNRSDAPHMTFKKAGAQTLKLSLFFDTYESEEDVSKTTNKLWKFMQPKEPRNGGDKSLDQLVANHSALPATPAQHTGGGGWHYFFNHPGGKERCTVLASGLDLKGDGGYVLVEPSNHASGGSYRWQEGRRL